MNNSLLILSNKNIFWGTFIVLTMIYIRGLFSDIYGIDASIYASISAEMIDTNHWLQIFHKGNDYLDKPPLHFWLSALSFKIFGVSSFAYKLPSFLFTILGTYSTYRLGKILYSSAIGKLSALMFYSCFSIMLINLDVRTDTILVGIVVFSVWHLIAYVNTNNYWNFTLGFIGIGLAMLTKGPIGLMVPVLALGVHFLIKKEWKNIFKWQWIVGLIITGVVISPMLWGLYHQFDLQPTKDFHLASGKVGTGTSGLKFYFWDQSFGRITGGNSEWKDDSTPLFFTHTFLWSFLPWSIIGVFGLFFKLKNSFKSIKNKEFYTLGAIILPFIAMSMSQFKLPHYIYVFFPMWFILTGWYFINLKEDSVSFKLLKVAQIVLSVAFIIVSVISSTYFFPTSSLIIWAVIVISIIGLGYSYLKLKGKNQLVTSTLIGFICVGFIFNFQFMPSVLKYNGLVEAAIKSKELKANTVYSNNAQSLIFDVYGSTKVLYEDVNSLDSLTNNNNYIFIRESGLESVLSIYDEKAVYSFSHFSATKINLIFLNPATREQNLEKFYLVEI